MAVTSFEDRRRRLLALAAILGDRLDLAWQTEVQSSLDHGELGLGLEWMADGLSEAEAPIRDEERRQLLELATEMQMNDRVQRALALCPPSPR